MALVATVGLLVGGAVAAPAASAQPDRSAPTPVPAVVWGACADSVLQTYRAECGFLTVPLDHARPSGPTVRLAISRIRHTREPYQGVMLVNPGGPGGSGQIMSVLGNFVPGGAGASYDWIGFDPRGVGRSVPALACDGDYAGYRRPPFVPSTAAIEKAWLARTARYAKDCAKAGGPLLEHLRTTDTVRDMDLLRRALGADKINFYGFSYGTYLGQVYATRYPARVRRMVFDGVVDPRRVWYDANLDQNVAFDRNIKIYFDWLADHHSVYRLGSTGAAVEKRFYAVQRDLTRKPAGGVIGPAELTDVFVQAGYYVFGWRAVAEAFAGWVHRRDPAPLKKLYDESNPQTKGADNGYAVYLAVQCTDAPWPRSWHRWKQDHWRIHARAPFMTWGNAWFNAPCRNWAAKPGRPPRVDGTKTPPVLLISETLDAATPFSGALAVRKRFPRSVLIEGVGGTTHAGSLFGNGCVDGAIAAYLADGTLPRRVKGNTSDVKCPALPPPNPNAAESRRDTGVPGRAALQKQIGRF
jgi:pimeloyl-ACP methyl ester carboxylesterase